MDRQIQHQFTAVYRYLWQRNNIGVDMFLHKYPLGRERMTEWTYKKFTADEMEKLFNLAAKLPSEPDCLENPKGHKHPDWIEQEEENELRRWQ